VTLQVLDGTVGCERIDASPLDIRVVALVPDEIEALAVFHRGWTAARDTDEGGALRRWFSV
jgi:hypothetical protein